MKKVKFENVKTIFDGEFTNEDESKGADISKLLIAMMQQMPPNQQFGMPDAVHAKRIAEKILYSELPLNGVLELEDADYDWAVKFITTWAPRMYTVNAVKLKEAIENVVKEEKGAD